MPKLKSHSIFTPSIEKAVESYDIEYDVVAPISENDAKIFVLLKEIFRLIDRNDVVNILKFFKDKSDQEILYKLEEWIKEPSLSHKIMIEIENKFFNVAFLSSITCRDEYDTNKNKIIYKIILNEDESEKLLFCNTEIVFTTCKKRDECIVKLKSKLKYHGIKFI